MKLQNNEVRMQNEVPSLAETIASVFVYTFTQTRQSLTITLANTQFVYCAVFSGVFKISSFQHTPIRIILPTCLIKTAYRSFGNRKSYNSTIYVY